MSRFQDPYLAESTGFATGHSSGIAQGVNIGRQQGHSNGYTEGWNAAADEANRQLAQKDALIIELKTRLQKNAHRANEEVKKIDADRERLSNLILDLVERINLFKQRDEENTNNIKRKNLIIEEEKENHRSEYEKKHMAFLGVAAIAQSAMKMVSNLTLQEKRYFLSYYQKSSLHFQSKEYIEENNFPHDQEIIKQYLPDIHEMLGENIIPQVIADDSIKD